MTPPEPAGSDLQSEPLALGPGSSDTAQAAETERLKGAVRRLPRYLRLTWNLARDERVPRRAKTFLVVGGAYAISPVDLIPGIIPVAGQLDDVVVLLVALRRALNACPADLVTEHLGRIELLASDLDDDLAAAGATAKRLAANGLRAGGRLAATGARRLLGRAKPAATP